MLLVAAALSWQIVSSTGTVKLIQDSDQSIAQTNFVGRLIIDEESGLRGFEVTGEPSFLAPYEQASKAVPAAFDKLETLKLNESEHQLIAQLRADHSIWQESYAQPVITMTQAHGETAGVHDLALNQHGKQLMDKVRSDLQAVVLADEAHRARRVDRWRVQVRDMVFGLGIFAIVTGIFIGLFTRNRLHVVSDAYRTWVDTLREKNEELFLTRPAVAHDARLDRRRCHHLRRRWTYPHDEPGCRGHDRLEHQRRPGSSAGYRLPCSQ